MPHVRPLLIAVLFSFTLSACAASATPTATPAPTFTPLPTDTVTLEPTELKPTATATIEPTATPEPTETQIPVPSETPVEINFDELELMDFGSKSDQRFTEDPFIPGQFPGVDIQLAEVGGITLIDFEKSDDPNQPTVLTMGFASNGKRYVFQAPLISCQGEGVGLVTRADELVKGQNYLIRVATISNVFDRKVFEEAIGKTPGCDVLGKLELSGLDELGKYFRGRLEEMADSVMVGDDKFFIPVIFNPY